MQGRPLEVFRFGLGQRNIVFIGGIHSEDEDNSRTLALAVIDHFRQHPADVPVGVSVYIIPAMNPDGVALNSHGNARNVDLNRNWLTDDWQPTGVHPPHGEVSGGGYPLSEPETIALFAFLRDMRPLIAIGWHSAAPLVHYNSVGRSEELGEIYAQAAGYQAFDHWPYYPITGEMIESMKRIGIAAFDVELPDHQNSDIEHNLPAVLAVLQAL